MRKRLNNTVKQYTIRSVPAAVDTALRKRAKAEGKSLNEMALEALRQHVSIPEPPVHNANLEQFIGTWVEDPEFDAIIAEFDKVDEELWR